MLIGKQSRLHVRSNYMKLSFLELKVGEQWQFYVVQLSIYSPLNLIALDQVRPVSFVMTRWVVTLALALNLTPRTPTPTPGDGGYYPSLRMSSAR